MSGISTNRTDITLPSEVSQEVLQKVRGASAVMALAREIALPGRGLTIPVITGDPDAAWVSETGAKPVSNPSLGTKLMQAYKLAVIVPFSNEFRRDIPALYDAIVDRLPGALALQFDKTAIGAIEKPGENMDNFAACSAFDLVPGAGETVYGNLVASYTDVAAHGGSVNGYALSPAGIGLLMGAVTSTGTPIFTDPINGGFGRILGQQAVEGRGLYKAGAAPVGSGSGTPAIVGVAGDWSKAMFGIVEGVKIDFADQTGLTINSTQVNLWEHNMFAVRAEIEVGFRAVTDCFNLLLGATPAE